MNAYSYLHPLIRKIESLLEYSFLDPSILSLAFIHCSFQNEHPEASGNNERLEFLGDSILGTIISDYLFNHLPEKAEGELSALRSHLIDAVSCARYVEKLKVDSFLLLGKGERFNHGRGRNSILADLFEAIIGAIYLDGGLEAARSFFLNHFLKEIEESLFTPVKNAKALLQDYCQKNYQLLPTYTLISESGPDHQKEFIMSVHIETILLGQGKGSSKKEAQQAAAVSALEFLSQKEKGSHGKN